MPHKSRFSLEMKKQAVEACLSGRVSINECARENDVSFETLREWVRLYETRGIQGLIPVSHIEKYSTKTKYLAVEEYLGGGISQISVCKKYGIRSPVSLRQWIKQYNNCEVLKQRKSRGAKYMSKGRDTTFEERIEIVSHCVANDRDYGETSKLYKVSYDQVYSWVKKYENNGFDSLVDRRGKRKDTASLTEIEILHIQLKLKEAENLRLQMENDLLKKLEAIERG